MIAGIGIDSIEIERIAAAIRRNPGLKERLFTARELAQLPPPGKEASRLATLFAGKEAVLKALGTGLKGHSWQQVEIIHNQEGKPQVALRGQALETARNLGITKIHISLSHDQSHGLAFCIAEGGSFYDLVGDR